MSFSSKLNSDVVNKLILEEDKMTTIISQDDSYIKWIEVTDEKSFNFRDTSYGVYFTNKRWYNTALLNMYDIIKDDFGYCIRFSKSFLLSPMFLTDIIADLFEQKKWNCNCRSIGTGLGSKSHIVTMRKGSKFIRIGCSYRDSYKFPNVTYVEFFGVDNEVISNGLTLIYKTYISLLKENNVFIDGDKILFYTEVVELLKNKQFVFTKTFIFKKAYNVNGEKCIVEQQLIDNEMFFKTKNDFNKIFKIGIDSNGNQVYVKNEMIDNVNFFRNLKKYEEYKNK